jgi:ABC-type branched-subunit amino acid transport system ATPase component
MEKKILTINRLSKSFGGVQALKNLSIEVEEGELLGIIGPNGAGKTTLFNVISGQLRPDSGDVHFKGINITRLKAHEICRLGIVRTFQIVRPFRRLTVYENVLAACLNNNSVNYENMHSYVLKAIKDVELYDKVDLEASYLTIGQLKRLEIARSIVLNPKLLLLDEPFAGSSAEEISEIIRVIGNIQKAGVTIIIIEHVLRALMNIARRIIVLDRGEKIAEGEPKEVVANEEVIKVYLGSVVKRIA